MLTSLHADDWKSFGRGIEGRNVVRFGAVTLLVGPNASGKSNLLDALRFLQGAALDLPLADVLRGRFEGQREIWPGIRGHAAEASRVDTESFTLATEWRMNALEVQHRLSVATSDDVGVASEALSERGEFLAVTLQLPVAGKSSFAYYRLGKTKPATWPYSTTRSLLGQLLAQPRLHPLVLETSQWLRQALRDIAFLDIRPAAMRDYRPENGGQLGLSGENISPVLAKLSSDPARTQDVVDWIEELCAPEITQFAFDRTQLREVMMYAVERAGRKISARSMSDGTLRFLGHLVGLLTAPEGTIVVLEEPDVGLHPSRVRLLAELFENVAAKRRLQIIATTHSPTLLAHLPEETLANVVAFGRDRETGLTVCSRLGDLPHFATLRDSNELAHLVSTGWIERAM